LPTEKRGFQNTLKGFVFKTHVFLQVCVLELVCFVARFAFCLFSHVFLHVSKGTAEVTKVGFLGLALFLHVFIAFRIERAQVFAYSCSGFAVSIDFVYRLRMLARKSEFCQRKFQVSRVRLRACIQNTL